MQDIKKHIIFKGFTVLLVLAILLPSAVKVAHVFENHKHEVCINKSSTHFHALDLDCEFYKFKISNPLLISFYKYESVNLISELTAVNSRLYNFKYNHQQLPFSLRGPPELDI